MEVIESYATLTPDIFIVHNARWPAHAAPEAISNATFSFVLHSTWMLGGSKSRRLSIAPVEGVPGYPATTFTPACSAPRATASLPVSSFRVNFVLLWPVFLFGMHR